MLIFKLTFFYLKKLLKLIFEVGGQFGKCRIIEGGFTEAKKQREEEARAS